MASTIEEIDMFRSWEIPALIAQAKQDGENDMKGKILALLRDSELNSLAFIIQSIETL